MNFVSDTVFKTVSQEETFFNQSDGRKFENCLFAQQKVAQFTKKQSLRQDLDRLGILLIIIILLFAKYKINHHTFSLCH